MRENLSVVLARLDASLPPGCGLGAAIENVGNSAGEVKSLIDLVIKIEQVILAMRHDLRKPSDTVGSKRLRDGENADELLARVSTPLCHFDPFQFSAPKGKFPLDFFEEGFSVGECFVKKEDVSFTIVLPDMDLRGNACGHHSLYVSLACAYKMGKQNVSVIQIPERSLTGIPAESFSAISDLPAEVGEVKRLRSLTSCGRAFSAMGKSPLVTSDPGVFQSSNGNPAVRCYHKVNEGYLYPLSSGWLFSGKPVVFISRESVVDATIGGSALKTVEVKIKYSNLSKKCASIEYGMISREEVPFLKKYITNSSIVHDLHQNRGTPDQAAENSHHPETIMRAGFEEDDSDHDFSPTNTSDDFSESDDESDSGSNGSAR